MYFCCEETLSQWLSAVAGSGFVAYVRLNRLEPLLSKTIGASIVRLEAEVIDDQSRGYVLRHIGRFDETLEWSIRHEGDKAGPDRAKVSLPWLWTIFKIGDSLTSSWTLPVREGTKFRHLANAGRLLLSHWRLDASANHRAFDSRSSPTSESRS